MGEVDGSDIVWNNGVRWYKIAGPNGEAIDTARTGAGGTVAGVAADAAIGRHGQSIFYICYFPINTKETPSEGENPRTLAFPLGKYDRQSTGGG